MALALTITQLHMWKWHLTLTITRLHMWKMAFPPITRLHLWNGIDFNHYPHVKMAFYHNHYPITRVNVACDHNHYQVTHVKMAFSLTITKLHLRKWRLCLSSDGNVYGCRYKYNLMFTFRQPGILWVPALWWRSRDPGLFWQTFVDHRGPRWRTKLYPDAGATGSGPEHNTCATSGRSTVQLLHLSVALPER